MARAPRQKKRHLLYNLATCERLLLKAGCFLFCLPLTLSADQLRFDTARDWRQWQLPLGAVELTPDGAIEPTRIRKVINAARNAADFGGGIRDAGSNRPDARLAIDEDPTTGWSPDPGDDSDRWFIEIDLGRGVSANSVTLIFAEDAPPFELFDLLFSTGEPKVDNVGNPVEGTLMYRIRERFKENERQRIIYKLDKPPGLTAGYDEPVLSNRNYPPFGVAGTLRGGFFWGAAGGKVRRAGQRGRIAPAERRGKDRVLEKPERRVTATTKSASYYRPSI